MGNSEGKVSISCHGLNNISPVDISAPLVSVVSNHFLYKTLLEIPYVTPPPFPPSVHNLVSHNLLKVGRIPDLRAKALGQDCGDLFVRLCLPPAKGTCPLTLLSLILC